MHAAMYVYPWDLAEEGVEAVAGRLLHAGLDTITVAASYHAGKFVRPHAPQRKVYFPEDGTVYFRPRMERYGRIKPRVNTMVAEFDALRLLERQAPGLRRIAWTVGLHNTPLGMQHPNVVARTAFGDPLYNSLCPSHPAVRDYLVALCADLGADYSLAGIAIEAPGWQAYRHGYHHEFELIDLGPRAETMLGMCFCDACRTRAEADGTDVDRLQARTQSELEAFLLSGRQPETDPGSDPDWQAFIAFRARVVTSLVREVREALNPEVELAIIPTVLTPNDRCWVEGSDLAALARTADRLEVPAYQTGPAAIALDMQAVREKAGAAAALSFILRPSFPNLRDADEVNAAVQAARTAGTRSISFYNYGHIRLESLDWIRAALG
jgi:hypothetical protein